MKKIFLLFGCFVFLAMSVFAQKFDVQLSRKGSLPNQKATAKLVRVSPTPTRDASDAHIILTAGDVWGDGTGYQMLLDADHTAYGVQIPTTGALTASGNASAAVYNAFEYKIPVNADGVLTTSNIVLNNSIGIDIPAGIYDFCITNPTPGDRMWIASSDGPQPGRADDFEFLGGYSYEFVVTGGWGSQGSDGTTLITTALVPIEIALTNLVTPVSGQNLTATEQVKVTFKNLGTDPINSVDLYLTVDGLDASIETYNNQIASGASVNYTFSATADLSAFGPHTVIVTVDVSGDANSANNKIEATINNIDCSAYSALPFEENFEGGAVPPNICWGNLGDPGWFHSVAGASNMGTYFGSHTQFAFFDDDKWGMGKPQSDLYLITPALDLSTALAPKLKFDYLYRRYSDKFTVEVSVAGGAWQLLDTLATTQSGSTGVWVNEKEMSLATYAGQSNVRIAFHYNDLNGWRYGVAVDNIKVWSPVPNDISVLELTAPVSGQDLTATEQVKVKVKNNGSSSITSVKYILTVDGGTDIEETDNTTIAPNADYTYTFSAVADLSAYSTHTVKVAVEIAGESNVSDNTIEVSITNVDCSASGDLPFEEKFENNFPTQGCWIFTETASGHHISLDPLSNLAVPFDGADGHFIGFNDDAAGNGSADNLYALLPTMDFSSVSAAKMSFDYLVQNAADIVTIEYTTDVAAPYNYTTLETLSVTGGAWVPKEISLVALANLPNVRIAIHYNDNAGWKWGFGIDNIKIWEPAPQDVTVLDITYPSNPGQNLSATEYVKVKVKNNGSQNITDLSFHLFVDDTEVTSPSEQWSGIITPNNELEYTFTTPADLSTINTDYEIKVVADLANDPNIADNSIIKTIKNIDCSGYTVPFEEDFNNQDWGCWTTTAQVYPWEFFDGQILVDYGYTGFEGYAVYNEGYDDVSNGTVDQWLISPNIDATSVTEGLKLTFKAATSTDILAANLNSADFLVKVSTDNGNSWTTEWTEDSVPAFTTWNTFDAEVNLSAYAGQHIKIAFNFVSLSPGGGANIFIDNVKLSVLHTNDLAVVALVAPSTSGVNLSSTEIVKVKVKNVGINNISSVNFYLTVDNVDITPIPENYSGTITPGAEYTYTFNAKANLSAAGAHTIKAIAEITSDGNTADNSILVNVENHLCSAKTLPYEEGFENITSDPCEGTIIDADGDGHTWIIHTEPLSIAPHNGTNCAVSYSWYQDVVLSPENWLITPELIIPNNQNKNTVLTYYVKGQDPNYSNETYNVKISIDGAPYADKFGETLPNGSADWLLRTVDLNDYKGHNIKIAFVHENSTDVFAIALDDILVQDVDFVGIVDELTLPQVSIYPNPAKNVVNVQVEETSFVKVYDAAGKLVDSFTATAGSNNAYQNVAGVYFFNINGKTYRVVFE
jgi:gingipain R/gingipain K